MVININSELASLTKDYLNSDMSPVDFRRMALVITRRYWTEFREERQREYSHKTK